MLRLSRIVGLLVAAALLTGFAPHPQAPLTPVVSLSVNAGYNTLFRENHWIPLLIRISNDGDATAGRLVVRPETSGNAFTNTFSTPIELAPGSRQVVFLYITARSFANLVRVELIDHSGVVVASREAALRGVVPQDQVHIVLTQSSAGSVDLTGVHASGFNAHQANWLIEELPDNPMGLQAANTLVFSDIDTGAMSLAQRAAVADWVAQGGHLIVTGGANWQATASGLLDLLPLIPEGSAAVTDLGGLAALANRQTPLRGDTISATGTLAGGAQVLARADNDLPLLARRAYGLGTVDYLTVDPMTQPLRGWPGMGDVWFTLAASVSPVPAWVDGFGDLDRATASAEILPGFDLLPNVLPLCGFLALYVALIGPINYAVLNRINRREFAWLTIPLFIILFSVLAWVVGFNLRGNTVTLSRLAVVQSWADTERAQVNGLVGLLSPRRTTYTLTMDDGSFLRPIARNIQANPFASSVQASTEIRQGSLFRAENFLVDASFIATFAASGTIEKPAISGQAALFYDQPNQQWALRGSVRNDSDLTLTRPVILARGEPLALEGDLEPGSVRTFDLALDTRPQPAPPSPLERNPGLVVPRFGFQRFAQDLRTNEQSIIDLLGNDRYDPRAYTLGTGTGAFEQERRRRQLFVGSFGTDHYFSTGRGDHVFLAGWSDDMPLQTNLGDTPWEAVDTTLYIVELQVNRPPITGRVRVNVDQFTWVSTERLGMTTSLAPVNTMLQSGDLAAFRFTPLPGVVLSQVDELRLVVDTPTNLREPLIVEIWDWAAQTWETVELQPLADTPHIADHRLTSPDSYLGAHNAVQIRVTGDDSSSLTRYIRVGVEQFGRF
jgi:hypothetical protein